MTRDNLLVAIILTLGIVVIFTAQFLTPTLYDADGYLHIRMAEFLRDLGPRYDFHWARYSTFSSNFADKDFLYHLFLIPFTSFKNIFFGVKIASVVFASLLFLSFYSLLRKYSHKTILPFFLICFFLSAPFLESISSPRPMTIVILTTIITLHLIIERQYVWVFFTGLFYALIHITSPLIIFYALAIETIRYFDKRQFYWKNALAAFFGVAAGFLFHPNFPNNFLVFYLNSILVPLYTMKTGVLELGAEFFPLNTREYLLGYPAVIIGIILLIYIALSKRPKPKFATQVFLALSMFFFVLSFICRRYLSHGYLIMLLGLAAYLSDFMETKKYVHKSAMVVILILLAMLGINSVNNIRYNAFVARVINGHYERIGKWMNQNIPPGELIFHANWSDSQYFIKTPAKIHQNSRFCLTDI